MEEIVGEGRPTSYQFYTSTPDFQIDIADCLCKIKWVSNTDLFSVYTGEWYWQKLVWFLDRLTIGREVTQWYYQIIAGV